MIDIGTSMGDGAQLGSLLVAARRAGGPGRGALARVARPADHGGLPAVGRRRVRERPAGALRGPCRWSRMLLLYLPRRSAAMDMLWRVPWLDRLLHDGPLGRHRPAFYRRPLSVAVVLFAGSVVLARDRVLVPRVLRRRAAGKRYTACSASPSRPPDVARLSNCSSSPSCSGTAPTSSGICARRVRRCRQGRPVPTSGTRRQTGLRRSWHGRRRNDGRGRAVAHQRRLLEHIVRLEPLLDRRAQLPRQPHPLPSQGRTGDNCLLATKVMVPMDGPAPGERRATGIPAVRDPADSVDRDTDLDHLATGDEFRRRLRAKNRYNRQTIGLVLLSQWLHWFVIVLLAMITAEYVLRSARGRWRRTGGDGGVHVRLLRLVERAAAGFRPLQPRFCSIYEPYFWWHERYWKMVAPSTTRCSPGRRSRTSSPVASGPARPAGVRRRLLKPERTLVVSATTARSTPAR